MQETLEVRDLDEDFSLDSDSVQPKSHLVRFYEKDLALVDSLVEFIGAGLKQGDRTVVIATADHRRSLEERLQEVGFCVPTLVISGQYVPLGAAETLSKFMVGRTPSATLFRKTIEPVIAKSSEGGRPVRAFGEMVALLWAQGNREAAIQLEEFWNELAKTYSFALLCGYCINEFAGDGNADALQQICRAHSRVLPAESYSNHSSTPEERVRTIVRLQQKAASLERELAIRKRAEEALAQRTKELSDFLENATEAIHKVGPDGQIQWANQAELDMLGYSADEYIGRNIAEFHEDPAVIEDILARLNRDEKLRDYEARLKRKDGEILWVTISSSVSWDNEQIGHTKCFTRDITERKLASELLEQTVAERTRQLEETVGELEAFSYSVSHDMRAPLRAMDGYARALLREYAQGLPAEAQVFLERIARASNRLDLLIRDILAFSKISKSEIELRPVDFEALLNHILQENPDLELARSQIRIDSPLHSVMGHEAYLTQVITNLIGNALKFVAPGTVAEIKIRSELLGDQVRVWICDNGIGIKPEHYERIFQIFGRVHSEKQFPGTGIGLAVVKKAVSRMGGQTGFESAPGQGSQFWFTLPRVLHGN